MAGVRVSTLKDVEWLAPRLRLEDIDEIKAASGSQPHEALMSGLLYSDDCLTMVADDEEPVGMFGVAPSPAEGVGHVWMLCTPRLPEEYSRRFIKECREGFWTSFLHRNYPVLTNHVDERNMTHVRWLRWLGFKFIMRHPSFGYEGRPFLEFVRIDNV